MRIRHGVRFLVGSVAAATALLAAALPGAASEARSTPVLHAREIAAPHLPAGARIIGRTPSSERLTTSVFLSPKSPSALAAFAADVSDVHSALFRHYLARGQFAARFGPTPASLHAVESFVRAAGLRIDSLSSNHLSLAVTGSVGEYAAAFATSFVNVRRASGAVERTTSATRLPASIASSVVGVIGLTDLLRPHDWIMRHGVEARGVGRHVVRVPVGTSAGAPVACPAAVTSTEQGYGGITDDQVSRAYGVDGLYAEGDLGQGQTVAIFELEPFSTSDVATFDTCYFGRSHTSQITTVNVDGGPGVGPGDGESALDIENVSAIAPDAKILVYQAPNTEAGSIDAYNQIVSDDLAQSVTTSWGFCESDALGYSPGSLAAENVIFEQAAAQGETVFNASGDGGNDACAYQSWSPTSPVETENDPASQPYVVGVVRRRRRDLEAVVPAGVDARHRRRPLDGFAMPGACRAGLSDGPGRHGLRRPEHGHHDLPPGSVAHGRWHVLVLAPLGGDARRDQRVADMSGVRVHPARRGLRLPAPLRGGVEQD